MLKNSIKYLPYNFSNTLDSYSLMIDPLFQSISSNRKINPREEELIKNFYKNLIDSLINKKMLNCFDRIEPRFKLILSEFFNFFPNLNFSKIHNIDYEIKIENIGQYNIFNIQKEREKNGFISEYDLNREGKNLFCVKRNEKGEKLTIQTKTEKILEGVNEMNNSMNWRKKLKETEYFKKFNNFMDSNLSIAKPWTSPKLIWKNIVEKTKIDKIQMNSILIEDFRITSNIGLEISNENEQKIQEKEGFFHYIRTEKIQYFKEAPSNKDKEEIRIIDFDNWLRGNPPLLVKRYDIKPKPINLANEELKE